MAKKKRSWISKLLDMDDNSVSASTVFLIITSIVATLLLLVPGAALMIEVIYNHTIVTDLTGMGTYIAAVVSLYISGGLLKGWTNFSNYKYGKHKNNDRKMEDEDEEDEENINEINN